MLRITPIEEQGDPYRLPDLVLDDHGVGDLVLTGMLDPVNPGDLQCGNGLRTQVIIALLTDARAEPSELRSGDENRGWIGDTFDVMAGETPIGSKLWLLRRSALYDGIEVQAELHARLALKTLIDQGACVRVDVTVTVDRPLSRLDMAIALYGREGAKIYNEKFELLWRQIDALASQTAR